MPHYTAVFAVTEERRIMILRCYRHAIGQVTLTIPGGMIEESESPLTGIQRELLEETGYKAKEWNSLGDIHRKLDSRLRDLSFVFRNRSLLCAGTGFRRLGRIGIIVVETARSRTGD